MSRLFEAQVHPQLVEYAKANLLSILNQGQGQLVHSIESYLPLCPDALQYYTLAGCAYLKQVNQIADQAKKQTIALNELLDAIAANPMAPNIGGLHTTVVAIYGMLSEMAIIGVDITKDMAATPTEEGRSKQASVHVYVGSISILRRMQRDRFFVTEIDADEEKAFARKILKALESNLIYGMRLDIDHIYEGRPIYKPTKPRGGMALAGQPDSFKLFPIPVMYPIADLFKEVLGNNLFRFVENRGGDGTATRVCTFSAEEVGKVYYGQPDNLIQSAIKRAKPGYSVIYNTFRAYNVQGSLHDRGYSAFRLDRLISISPVQPAEIDKALHMVNPEFLRGIFITKVNAFKTTDFDDLKDPTFNPASYPNNQDRAAALISHMYRMDTDVLFMYIKARPALFGDLKKHLDTRERISSKMLKKLEFVDLPVDEMHKEALIKDLLSKGLVKLTTRSTKSETEKVVLASNNKDVLQRLVGKGYVKKYGSDGVRLRAFRAQLQALPSPSKAEIEALAGEWRVLDRLSGVDFGNLDTVIDTLNTVLVEMKDIPEATGLIPYKNCTPQNSADFYKSVYAANIMQCEFAPFE